MKMEIGFGGSQIYTTDVLVVGGGTGGTAAAIQAARRGVQTILVSEFYWLGGMLTSAGVSAPDGNELAAWQTGLWGEFLRELRQRQPGGLDHSWVSLFSYDPRIGAKIFADWVLELPNLLWIPGKVPLAVSHQSVRFTDFTVKAKIIIDGTELGDLLALAAVPHRWGWELQSEWGEPSAPTEFNFLTDRYPIQAPTWVVIMQDFGNTLATDISCAPGYEPSPFVDAWNSHGKENFLNYGRLPGGRFMINWPICGNDYGTRVGRLLESETSRHEFNQECLWHSQNFAHFIQSQLGRHYGLSMGVFPHALDAFALHPYYRESRRLLGLTTICEQDILPMPGGRVAAIFDDAIAIGNYPNDHHYPGIKYPLRPKSIRWGGRWTGTPFTISYRCLIPATVDGFLVCEKNISVSHIANGATRLQPVVLGIGQAAGMAAAMCVELNCQPRDLQVRKLQIALLQDTHAPAAIVPLFNLPPNHPQWFKWQVYYLDNPQNYPQSGYCPCPSVAENCPTIDKTLHRVTGVFECLDCQDYRLMIADQTWQLVTERWDIDQQLQDLSQNQLLTVWGRFNPSGRWLLVEYLDRVSK
jgi:hypothetical protein